MECPNAIGTPLDLRAIASSAATEGGDDVGCGRGDAGDARVDARDERSWERAHRGRARESHARVS